MRGDEVEGLAHLMMHEGHLAVHPSLAGNEVRPEPGMNVIEVLVVPVIQLQAQIGS